MKTPAILALALTAASVLAQNVTVPNYCTTGYEAGTDTVIYETPYTYSQVMSIIGSFKNLTWSGNPDDTVSLNGTDNTVGTARTYTTDNVTVVETLLLYSKPKNGPYDEVHNTALFTVAALNVSLYIIYDGTTVTEECNGAASTFNFTAHYCATNTTAGGDLLHYLHSADAVGAATLLGGANFTTCEALSSNATANSTAPSRAGSTAPTHRHWRPSPVASVARQSFGFHGQF